MVVSLAAGGPAGVSPAVRTAAPTRRKRRWGAVVLAAVAALVLSACGARIDTALNVDANGAGTRVMTLTLSENIDTLVGGTEAADASIRRHLPPEVEYSGLAVSTTVTAVFTITFANPDEYRTKVAALLAAGDMPLPEGNLFTFETTPFVSGASIKENFSSRDLMQWMFAGLLADGVVPADQSGNMSETGATVVNYNGIAFEEYEQISFEEVDDNGFNTVTMTTTIDPANLSRTITFSLAEKAQYNSNTALYDEYFAALEGQGMTVEPNSANTGMSWDVTFTASSSDEMVTLTNTALSSQETAFAITTQAHPDVPLTAQLEVTDFAECRAICSPRLDQIDDALVIPETFTFEGSSGRTNDDGLPVLNLTELQSVTMAKPISFTTATAELAIDSSGGVTWKGQFAVANEDAELIGEGIEAVLSAEGTSEVATSAGDTDTTYTVNISGADGTAFAGAYDKWAGGGTSWGIASLYVTDGADDGLLKRHYTVRGMLPLQNVSAALPADGVAFTLTVPSGENIEKSAFNPSTATVDGSTATFQSNGETSFDATVRGTPTSAWFVYGGIALAVLLVAGALVLFRKKIAAFFAKQKVAMANRRAAQAAALAAQPPAQAAYIPPQGQAQQFAQPLQGQTQQFAQPPQGQTQQFSQAPPQQVGQQPQFGQAPPPPGFGPPAPPTPPPSEADYL